MPSADVTKAPLLSILGRIFGHGPLKADPAEASDFISGRTGAERLLTLQDFFGGDFRGEVGGRRKAFPAPDATV